MTDGDVQKAEEVIQLVREQAGTTRIFTFAIGNEADKNMLHGTDTGARLIFYGNCYRQLTTESGSQSWPCADAGRWSS